MSRRRDNREKPAGAAVPSQESVDAVSVSRTSESGRHPAVPKGLPRLAACAAVAVAVLLAASTLAYGQPYDLLLKGGHVLDPTNRIDAAMDVAILGEEIARIAQEIPASDARRVVDVTGLYVVPGLIDIHAHVFVGNRPRAFAAGFSSVSPDDFTFRSGVTTIVDAGTSGWRNFEDFREQVIDQSNTRVLAFLNIVGRGMWDDQGNHDLDDMDPVATASMLRSHPEIIVGTKIGHFSGESWEPFDRAMAAAVASEAPLLLECHLPELPLRHLLGRMRPGDIFTHAFGGVDDRDPVLDENGKVHAYVLNAKARGVLFDVGHGGGSFHFHVAAPALEQGLVPNTFGTDLHRGSMNAGMKDMLNIMSKYLNMGMSLADIVERATWGPARALRRDDIGHLGVGATADVAVLGVENGRFGFVDAGGFRMSGERKLSAELTIRAGRVVWDLNGISARERAE